MMKKKVFILSVVLNFCFALSAKADIEPVNGLMDNLTGVETIKSSVQSVQSLKDTVDSVKAQGGDLVNSVKSTVQGVTDAAQSAIDGAKNMAASVQNLDFAGTQGMFDGSKTPNEQESAVMDNLIRKKGEDSISSQKELSKALNMKAGKELEGIFAHALAMRVKIQNETDDNQNPESMQTAISLAQDEAIKAIKRRNQIVLLEAMNLAFKASRALNNLEDGGDDEE